MDVKKCISCNEYKSTNEFYRKSKNMEPRVGRCKQCYKTHRRKSEHTPKNRWKTYRRHAKRRGLIFDLTEKQFASFSGLQCYYCGDEVNPISLDRIDNDIGYRFDNVVSCCHFCNSLKHVMDEEDFLIHVEKIYLFQINRVQNGK